MPFQRIKKDEWIIAIRKRSGQLLPETAKGDGFTFVPNSLRYWCADPFLFCDDGERYLFFEMYDRLKRKGALGFRRIKADGSFSKIQKCYETDTHLSYPFLFRGKDNRIYMLPESSNSNEMYLLRAKNFPCEWEKICVLQEGKFADTTLFAYDGCVYAYTTRIEKDNVSRLELFCFDEEKKTLTALYQAPVLNDRLGGRMAGSVFQANKKYVRPAQDSRKGYGGGLAFYEIVRVGQDGYEEKLLTTLSPSEIPIKKNAFREGVHTYNFDEEYEVIDLKRKTANPIEWLGFALNKWKRWKK